MSDSSDDDTFMYFDVEDLFDDIKLIPEPTTVEGAYTDYYEGHARCVGDYWHCYCYSQPTQVSPPKTIDEFIHCTDRPEQVKAWWEKYRFTIILTFCDECQGGVRRYIFGWWNSEVDIKEEPLLAGRSHIFSVDSDGRLHLVNEMKL